jgi:Spy/CpxP family protein refolding chaperone
MKSTSRVLFALALLAPLVLIRPASAQRFFGSRTNSLTSLAANEAVQKDLGVSRDVAGKLNALGDEYRAASQKEFTALGIDYSAVGDLPALERAAEMRKVTEKTAQVNRKLAAEFTPKLAEVLTPEQLQRVRQIQLQASGIDVWTEPDVGKELDLSDDQKQKINELRNEYSRRQQQLDGDFQQRFARIRELNAERDTKALELLTSNQKAKLTELKGAPFDVSQLGFGRRRGNN